MKGVFFSDSGTINIIYQNSQVENYLWIENKERKIYDYFERSKNWWCSKTFIQTLYADNSYRTSMNTVFVSEDNPEN